MGTERYTLTTVYADIDFTRSVLKDGINRACVCTFTAPDAELFPEDHPTATTLPERTCGAGRNALRIIACKTVLCCET